MKTRDADLFAAAAIVSKLGRAVAQGVALASIATASGCADTEAATRDAATEPRPMVPYPQDELGCWGPVHDGGYYGQCCVEAHCYTPSGSAKCADAAEARPFLPNFPPGSGDCGCLLGPDSKEGTAGPYAPNRVDTPRSAGECCYLVGSIACTGRPLVVAGRLMIAPLTPRLDWAVFA